RAGPRSFLRPPAEIQGTHPDSTVDLGHPGGSGQWCVIACGSRLSDGAQVRQSVGSPVPTPRWASQKLVENLYRQGLAGGPSATEVSTATCDGETGLGGTGD